MMLFNATRYLLSGNWAQMAPGKAKQLLESVGQAGSLRREL